MLRSYRHAQQYEKETLRMRETGMTRREIGEKLRLSKEQIKMFINRYKKADEDRSRYSIKKKGRPPKDYVVREEDKVAELKYLPEKKQR